MRLNFLARQLAYNLSQLGKSHGQLAYSELIRWIEWPSWLELEVDVNLQPAIFKELLAAAVSFAPAKKLWDLRPYHIAAMLSQLSAEEQRLLCNLFKEIYCDSLPPV